MRAFTVVVAAVLVLAIPGTAWADHRDPPPKHDDTGCCVSFDQSPVVICATKDACTFTGPKP